MQRARKVSKKSKILLQKKSQKKQKKKKKRAFFIQGARAPKYAKRVRARRRRRNFRKEKLSDYFWCLAVSRLLRVQLSGVYA